MPTCIAQAKYIKHPDFPEVVADGLYRKLYVVFLSSLITGESLAIVLATW